MPNLMMFITENVTPGLRGELTKWMLQLKPGVFVGTLTSLVGEKLWQKIRQKQKTGGAIWVKATNNEQRFKLKISGSTHWKIRDYDGIQLIIHPHKKPKLNMVTKKKIAEDAKSLKPKPKIPAVTWDPCGTPNDCVTRKALFEAEGSKIKSSFSGTSAYGEYPPNQLWEDQWLEDIKKVATSLLSYLHSFPNRSNLPFHNKKLVCLDLETTDYLPKAYEGFINIIGVAVLDLRDNNTNKLGLQLFQAFNMTRKKKNVPALLELVKQYLQDVDVFLVFNQKFDVQILNRVISEFSFDLKLPSNIVDLFVSFQNLKTLEKYLHQRVGVTRTTTDKDKYSEYYTLFKGKGRLGSNKKIEPIGTYNLMDVLTPLYVHLILETPDKT